MKSIKLFIVLIFISFRFLAQENIGRSIERNEEAIESTPIVVFSVFADSGRSLLFVDTKDNIQYKLNLSKPFRVGQFFANNPGLYRGQKYVLFKAKTADVNKDDKVGYGDPDYLFICDTHGQNIKQISLNNLHVKSCIVNKQTNTVTFVVTENPTVSGNLKFNYKKDSMDKIFIFNLNSELTTEVKN